MSMRWIMLWALSLLLIVSCGDGEPEEKRKILARVNDYDVSLYDFETRLASELELNEDYKLTREARRAFLEQMIQQEILIQEAKKRNLDTREEFIRTIERYWESTLIRDLMELKGKEISKKIYVSEEEIKELHRKRMETDPRTPPLEEIRPDLRKEVRERKRHERLAQWLRDLRKNADIEINTALMADR